MPQADTEKTLDPRKIMTSYKIEGPTGEATITLTRLEAGEIEVMMETSRVTEEPVVTSHKSYERAILKAADHVRRLVYNRVIG